MARVAGIALAAAATSSRPAAPPMNVAGSTGRNAEEQSADQLTSGERAGKADHRAHEGHAQPLPQNQPQNAYRTRPHRHAQRQFPSSPGDQVRDAVDTHNR